MPNGTNFRENLMSSTVVKLPRQRRTPEQRKRLKIQAMFERAFATRADEDVYWLVRALGCGNLTADFDDVYRPNRHRW